MSLTTLQTVIDDVSKFETLLPVSFLNGELLYLIEKF